MKYNNLSDYHSRVLTSVLFLCVFFLSAHIKTFGQSRLSITAEPIFGSITLNSGFSPDVHTVNITSGGTLNVQKFGLCTDCKGFYSPAPSYNLNWTGSSAGLRVFFEAEDADKDATLIIHTPNGTWIGNDDAVSGCKNPLLLLEEYGAGQYNIWVGSYTTGELIPGILKISESDVSPCSEGTDDETSQLDLNSAPTSGTVALTSGFSPDTLTVNLTSGGPVNVTGIGEGCAGFAPNIPQVKLQWTGSTNNLRVFFKPDDKSKDATLIINTPEGTLIGNDDAFSGCTNPMLTLSEHGEGNYDIWVGSYRTEEFFPGTLYITELEKDPCETERNITDSLNATEEPTFETVRLSQNFVPDSQTVRVTSGGSVDVSTLGLNAEWRGFVSSAPDVRLYWTGSSTNLRIYFKADDSSGDATLIIKTPNGTWLGNDDTRTGCNNPMLLLSEYGEGEYNIWVGSYSTGNFITGNLTITENSTEPCESVIESSPEFNLSGDPISGTVRLRSGFSSNAHSVRIKAGGSINVQGLCSDCVGNVFQNPDYVLNWSGSTDNLRIYFKADNISDDATLLIKTPDGTWIGNDDLRSGCNNNPMLQLQNYGPGIYSIWVGSYNENKNIAGILTITEKNVTPCDDNPDIVLTGNPIYGSSKLRSGFSQRLRSIPIIAFGSVDVRNVCSGCAGFTTQRPHYKLNWKGSSTNLRVFFEATDPEQDATLIIKTPNGAWIGNDDSRSGCNNPMLLLNEYGSGHYEIWVGSYSEGVSISGNLIITENDQQPR
ncbi:MAG: hypothetical protein PHT69_07010 [Bacteroidales bacterium]|nr:hypothetical protein [Bacteroidales bacterium]